MNELQSLRNKIDQIDSEIISLLEERIKIADVVAGVKNKLNMPLTDTAREDELLTELENKVHHPLLKKHIRGIYEILFTISKELRDTKPTLA